MGYGLWLWTMGKWSFYEDALPISGCCYCSCCFSFFFFFLVYYFLSFLFSLFFLLGCCSLFCWRSFLVWFLFLLGFSLLWLLCLSIVAFLACRCRFHCHSFNSHCAHVLMFCLLIPTNYVNAIHDWYLYVDYLVLLMHSRWWSYELFSLLVGLSRAHSLAT